MPPPITRHLDAGTQRAALRKLADMTARSIVEARVREAAIAITNQCRPPAGQSPDAQTALCELQAIYEAVKTGTPRVKGLEFGVRYVPDPIIRDYFVAPHRLLEWCEDGACGEDCDSQAALVVALCAAIGFEAGLTAWGKPGAAHYQHVFASVVFPKRGMKGARSVVALDTTVPSASVGWRPPRGRTVTAWIHRADLSVEEE
jgi:hypothetical protein